MKRALALAGIVTAFAAAPASAYTDAYVSVGGHGVAVAACTAATGCREVREDSVSFRGGVLVRQWIECEIAQPAPGEVPNCRPKFRVGVAPPCPVGPTTLCPAAVVVDSDTVGGIVAIPQDPIPALLDRLPGGGGPVTHCTLPQPVGC